MKWMKSVTIMHGNLINLHTIEPGTNFECLGVSNLSWSNYRGENWKNVWSHSHVLSPPPYFSFCLGGGNAIQAIQ